MRLTASANDLKAGLAGHVARRSPLEIIQHALITAADDCLTIETTDSERYLRMSVPATVDEPGAATAQPDLLKQLLGRLDGDVSVTSESDRVWLSCGDRRRYRFESLTPTDWPAFVAEDAKQVPFDRHVLAAAIDRLAYCADSSRWDSPYALGLQIHADYVCAQDKTRAAIIRQPVGLPDMVIPLASLATLRALLDRDDVRVTVYGDGPHALAVETPHAWVATRLINTKCPSVTDVVDRADGVGAVTFDVGDARQALARINPLASAGGAKHDAPLDVSFTGGKVCLAAANGGGQDAFDAEADGSAIPDAHVSGALLVDALQRMAGTGTWSMLRHDSVSAPINHLTCTDAPGEHVFACRLRT